MNANEITFGIEIEATLPSTADVRVGGHGCGIEIPWLPGWKADRDPSIHPGAGRIACEFVSPVLRGADGLREIVRAVREIKARGGSVNRSCGLHVHVGFDRSDVQATGKLAAVVSNFEKAIYASTGTKNRERGRWCGSINRHGSADRAIAASRANRYHVANFGSEHPTVEFRAFSASLNPQKVVTYVRLCVALVEKAGSMKRVAKWNGKSNVAETSPLHRKGAGQTQVVRMFYGLGWTKGDRNPVYGNLSGEGLPAIDKSKKTLMSLARKYDAQP